MIDKWGKAYMDTAKRFADLSTAVKLKVGAVVVKDNRIISIGYNGTPAGWDNVCEEVIEQHEDGGQVLKTKDEVVHAEANAIAKLASSSESGKDAEMYITHAPCIHCAKMIYGAGIRKVFFSEYYRDDSGIVFLDKCGIAIEKV